MKNIKSMCSIDKDYFKKNKDEVLKIIKKPKFYCEDCLRVAKSKKYLCEPKPISKE